MAKALPLEGRALTESTVRNMLTAIEAPLYDVGVLRDRGMLPGLNGMSAPDGSRQAFSAQAPQSARTSISAHREASIRSPEFRVGIWASQIGWGCGGLGY
jgi:hypothetical protein